MSATKTASKEKMIQTVLLNAFAIAMGFVAFRIVSRYIGGSNGEPMVNYIGDDYCQFGLVGGGGLSPAFPGGSQACQNGQECLDSGGTPFYESTGQGGQIVCQAGMTVGGNTYNPVDPIRTVSNDISSLSAEPSRRMMPNQMAQSGLRSDVDDSSYARIPQRNLRFNF